MPELVLDSAKLDVYELGAALVTALTFSEPRDSDEMRAHVLHSLCAWAIRTRAGRDPDWAGAAQAIKPVYAAWPEDEIDRDVTRLNMRMKNRMIAARMALAFLKPAHEGKFPALPNSARKLSVNRAAEWVLARSDAGDAANVKSRAWRPSREVLHLAAAVEVLRAGLATSKIVLDYCHLLWEPEVIAAIVREAQSYEPLFEALKVRKQLAIDPSRLIRVRIVSG